MSDQGAGSLALLASEELNRRIIEAMPGGIVHVAIDGAIVTANAEARRILGFSYDALSRRYTRDFDLETIREDGSPCPVEDYPVTRALATGTAQPPMVIGVRRPDGALCWAIFSAVPVKEPSDDSVTGAVVTFVDITERKRIEASLRSSEGLLRSIMESAPNPIVSTDREGRVIFANRLPPYIAMETFIGQPVWSPLPVADQEKVKVAHAKVVATGQVEAIQAAGPNESKWWAQAAPRYDGGAIVGVTYVAWDMTKEHELEARLAVADRLASIGTLAAGVAHELNNPLTYLLGNLDSLAALPRVSDDRDMRDYLAAATEGAERIRRVVTDLGSYSRIGEGTRVLSDARRLADAALRLANNLIGSRAAVEIDYPDAPAWITDDGRAAQVFLNLILNAAQSIGEGQVEANRIRVRIRSEPSDQTSVEIEDTGAGIPSELIDRVFEPFFTTKAEQSGTGLGLFICRNVVSALGGELTVESSVGKGSCFRVVLPSTVQDSERPRSITPEVLPADREIGPLRILVADDERAILEVMKILLRPHEVVTARSGEEAVELLTGSTFDIAFCDLIMPGSSGIDVYESLSRSHPGLENRLVFMTGGAFTERAQRFLERVSNPVLRKPFSRDDLQTLLRARVARLRNGPTC